MFRSRSTSADSTNMPSSPPSSPRKSIPLRMDGVANIFVKMRRYQAKAGQVIECSSGPEPETHPGLLEACQSPRKQCLERKDVYECLGAVITPTLLRATRNALAETAEYLGANALAEEQWKCSIHGPKHGGVFRVEVQYKASAIRTSIPDPHKPVALDKETSVPGLMTILRRREPTYP